METRVFLIRHGVTDWHRDRKVLGQRDIALNADGMKQAEAAAAGLAGIPLGEIVSSPLLRAVQTAEIIAARFEIGIARDPRLVDFRVGRWEGMGYDEVSRSAEYQRFLADPLAEKTPGGENLGQIRDRAVGAIEQAIGDVPSGESLAIVAHAGIIRVILTHYLGADITQYHRLRVAPGSISALSFGDDRDRPRLLCTNWRGALAASL